MRVAVAADAVVVGGAAVSAAAAAAVSYLCIHVRLHVTRGIERQCSLASIYLWRTKV